MRIVTGAPYGSNRNLLYKDTNQLPLQARRDRYKLLKMQELVHNLAPAYMGTMIERIHTTRENRSFDVRPPLARRSNYYNSFIPSTCREWNLLPFELKRIAYKKQFKNTLDKTDKYKRCKSNPYYNMGSRFINITLSRLRMECSDLLSDKFKRGLSPTKMCTCGYDTENVSHYILHCNKYNAQRRIMLSDCPVITVNTFLNGANNLENNTNVINAVSKFIHSSKRFSCRN